MSVHGFVLIAAGLEDLVIGLVVLLFLAIGALTQWLNKMRDAQQRRAPVRRPEGVRANVPPARDSVRTEIDDFLRDAARRRAAGHPQQAQQPGPPPAPAWRSPVAGQRWPEERPVELELIEPVPEDAGVADHVRKHLTTEEGFGSLPSDVAKRLSRSGEVIAERLHDVFDHQLTALEGVSGESAQVTRPEETLSPEDRITSVPATAAAGLAAMFADPGDLRQAILINEILQRPEYRWK